MPTNFLLKIEFIYSNLNEETINRHGKQIYNGNKPIESDTSLDKHPKFNNYFINKMLLFMYQLLNMKTNSSNNSMNELNIENSTLVKKKNCLASE